jgi:hypothetical protein
VDGRGSWRPLETFSSFASSLRSFSSLSADFLRSALVDGEIRRAELRDEDGDGEEVEVEEEQVVVARVMATLTQGRLRPIAASALMIVLASDLELGLLRRVGDRASGRERWVVLLPGMRWVGVPVIATGPPLNKGDHSLAVRTTMMLERAVRSRAHRHPSRARQPALDLDRPDAGNRPGSGKYITWNSRYWG